MNGRVAESEVNAAVMKRSRRRVAFGVVQHKPEYACVPGILFGACDSKRGGGFSRGITVRCAGRLGIRWRTIVRGQCMRTRGDSNCQPSYENVKLSCVVSVELQRYRQ